MAEKIWKKFEKQIKSVITNVDTSVLKKLRICFIVTPIEFLNSQCYDSLVKDTIDKISHDKVKVYKHLLDLKKCLKESTKSKLKSQAKENRKRRRVIEDEGIDDNFLVNVKDEEKDFLNFNNKSPSEPSNSDIISTKESTVDTYISRLENILEATKKEIERLEEDELSLDDLYQENNSFMMLDKLKAHSVKVWRKISKLRQTSSRLHSRQLKTFSFKGTIYPELNVNVEKCIKSKKFPDYHDIKSLVNEFFREKSINMTERKLRDLSLDIFTQIGNQLKKLRIKEFINYFGNHLTDGIKESENPIICNEDLKRTLVKNYNIGQIKMDEVLDKYSRLEQGHVNKDDDDISEISTEDSNISDNEESEESFEDVTIEDLRKQTTEHDTEEDIEDDEVEEPMEDLQHSIEDDITHMQSFVLLTNGLQNCDTKDFTSLHSITKTLSNDQNDTNGFCNVSNNVIYNEFIEEEFSLISNSLISIENSEAHIEEIHNIEQTRQGSENVIYPTIITINSSDDENSGSEEEMWRFGKNNYVYRSKLDDFCLAKLKRKEAVDTGIFITLEDSD